jgi:alpha-mannosidase
MRRFEVDRGRRNGAGGRLAAVLVGWLAIALADFGLGAGAAPETGIRWISVKPTVFLVREGEGLLHLAEVVVESVRDLPEATIEARLGGRSSSTSAGKVGSGKTTLRIRVPEALAPAELEIVFRSGTMESRHTTAWGPQRHWDVHFVPITHHDLGYTDTIENVLREYRRFYDDILRFCDETKAWPEESKYRYTCEGTWSIQDYVATRPADVVAKLAEYIREGRIEVTALFGNEISGLCGHEELIRLMYPSFRLKRLFGGEIISAGITDIPGLSWGLPTVLSGAGVPYFFAGLADYFQWGRSDIHTFWDEASILRHGRPDAFRWEGPDGQSILVYYSGGYGFLGGVIGPRSYEEVLKSLPGKLAEIEKKGSPLSVVRYIHNGVDNYPPNLEISRIVREWNEKWAYPRLWVATNAMFFRELEKRCGTPRTFRGEIPHTDYAVGAISTAKETSTNRRTHDVLSAAEKFATVASLAGGADYPAERIREAYDCMMLYDEHTWGRSYPTGEIQDLAWHEKSHYSYRAAGLAASMLDEGPEAIARKIDLGTDDPCLVVFNALSFPRTDVVRVSRFDSKAAFDLVDEETGHKVAWQLVKIEGPLDPVPYAAQRHARGQFEPHDLVDLVFVAENVPPLGHKTYRLAPRKGGEEAAFERGVAVTEDGLESRFFKVALDPKTGAVESIYDKELAKELVDREAPHGLNEPVVRWVQSGKVETGGEARIRKGAAGPVYGSLRVERAVPGCPEVIQEIILYDTLKRIDFVDRILKDSTPLLEVYVAFPFKIEKPQFAFEASDSVIVPLRDQFPGSNSNYYSVQHWADVSDGDSGVALSPVDSHLLEFGGLWPCYVSQAHHGVTPPDFGRKFVGPEEMVTGHLYSFIMDTNFRTNFQPVQQADMLFRYSVTTHRGTWKEGRPRDFGWAAASPLIAVPVKGNEGGALPKAMSFCTVDASNVLVLTVKKAEDGEGIIIRLIETEGREAKATVTFPHVTISKATRTNLVEEDAAAIPASPQSLQVDVKPFGIATVRVRGDWSPR